MASFPFSTKSTILQLTYECECVLRLLRAVWFQTSTLSATHIHITQASEANDKCQQRTVTHAKCTKANSLECNTNGGGGWWHGFHSKRTHFLWWQRRSLCYTHTTYDIIIIIWCGVVRAYKATRNFANSSILFVEDCATALVDGVVVLWCSFLLPSIESN